MRLLVCGGRDFADISRLRHILTLVNERRPITLLIEGGALGADRLAREWAQANAIPVQTFEADWAAHGKAAGPRRNARMLAEGLPDGVVAFPGGRGTADMVSQAEAVGVRVMLVRP